MLFRSEVLREAENCLVALRSLAIGRRILEISQQLIAAEQKGDQGEVGRLVQQQIELARLRRELESSASEA